MNVYAIDEAPKGEGPIYRIRVDISDEDNHLRTEIAKAIRARTSKRITINFSPNQHRSTFAYSFSKGIGPSTINKFNCAILSVTKEDWKK